MSRLRRRRSRNKQYELIVGIDPGKSGGIACLFPDNTIRLYNMPATDEETWLLLRKFSCYECLIVIEKISPGFPGTSKVSMAKLFGHYRMLSGMLVGLTNLRCLQYTTGRLGQSPKECHSDLTVVQAKKSWQRSIDFVSKSSGPQRKRELKAWCNYLFPSTKVTLKTCDALLLCEFGRRIIDDNG